MSDSNVVRIRTGKTSKTVKPTNAVKSDSKRSRKALKRQGTAAIGVGVVSLLLTGLSLSHLAQGVSIVTHSSEWQSWAMAIGIDLGFIGLELAMIFAANDKVRRLIGRYCNTAIGGTLVTSAVMNAYAFSLGSNGSVQLASAIALGIAIPALIYCLTKVAATLYLVNDSH